MLSWAVAGLAGVAMGLQGDSGSAETLRYASLPEIVQSIAVSSRKDGTLVVWLVDSIPGEDGARVADLFSKSVARSFAGTKTTHAVMAFGKTPKPVLNGSADLSAVAGAIWTAVLTQPDGGDVPNCLLNVRSAVSTFAAASAAKKVLVLFTQVNGDNEDDVEGTLAMLKRNGIVFHSIGSEALTSDTYWKRRPPPEPAAKPAPGIAPLVMKGPEAAFIEFPWGWPLGIQDPGAEAPSGYGYWALTRLASATGGKYAIYAEDGEGESFCEKHKCPICDGQHRSCGAAYDEIKIKMLRPELGPRPEVLARGSRDPLALSTVHYWGKLHEARLIGGVPELAMRAGQLVPNPEPKAHERLLLQDLLESVKGRPGREEWEHLRTAAIKQAKEIDGWTAEFSAIAKKMAPASAKRSVGIADAFLVHLKMFGHAFKQLAAFADEMSRAPKPAEGPFMATALVLPADKEVESIGARAYFLCHGGEPLKQVKLIGDLKELHADLDGVDKMIEKHRGTPWEIVMRRASLPAYSLNFRETEVAGGGGGGEKKEKKPKSKGDDTPTEGPREKEKPEVRTPRTGRSAGSGTASGGSK